MAIVSKVLKESTLSMITGDKRQSDNWAFCMIAWSLFGVTLLQELGCLEGHGLMRMFGSQLNGSDLELDGVDGIDIVRRSKG